MNWRRISKEEVSFLSRKFPVGPKENYNISVRMVDVPAEFQIGYIPDAS
jgi:hypothetical protein